MPAVEFESRLSRAGLTLALAAGTLANPVVLAVMSAGPVLLLVGGVSGARVLISYGWTFLAALPGIPVLSLALAFGGTHRRSARDLFVPVAVTADDIGLAFALPRGDTRADWGTFIRWRRLRGVHLLYNTARTFVALGTADLDADQRTALEDLLRAHVSAGPRR